MIELHCSDCLEFLKTLPDNSIDSVVTDPPYGLSFMGKKWDYDVPSQQIWEECLRVLKPGGYLLAFAGTRTQHRMAVRIEDAGFEIRDMIAWVYGSGFPKSLNIGKAVDKLQGNEREVVGQSRNGKNSLMGGLSNTETTTIQNVTKGTSEWEGWGTALKPSLEPITVARKPISENTVAENCLKWGTGGINIDGTRVGMSQEDKEMLDAKASTNNNGVNFDVGESKTKGTATPANNIGRFPSNLVHDGSDEVVSLFPNTGKGNGGKPYSYAGKEYDNKDTSMFNCDKPQAPSNFNDSGSASRFFYCAKSSKSERNRGLDGFEEKRPDVRTTKGMGTFEEKGVAKQSNHHPTVKPVSLMQYLVRLVTRKGGIVLDPFTGSGTTGIACKLEGMNFIGIEREQEYVDIAKARIDVREIKEDTQPSLFE